MQLFLYVDNFFRLSDFLINIGTSEMVVIRLRRLGAKNVLSITLLLQTSVLLHQAVSLSRLVFTILSLRARKSVYV